MKNIIAPIIFLVFLSGCTVLEKAGLYAAENPIVVQAATRQAVFRYTQAGNTEADKIARADQVTYTVNRVIDYLDGNPKSTSKELLTVIDSVIKWDSLTIADRVLVKDILALVSANLQANEKQGVISPDALIGLRSLFYTALDAAELL